MIGPLGRYENDTSTCSPGRCPGLGEWLGLRPVGYFSHRNKTDLEIASCFYLNSPSIFASFAFFVVDEKAQTNKRSFRDFVLSSFRDNKPDIMPRRIPGISNIQCQSGPETSVENRLLTC